MDQKKSSFTTAHNEHISRLFNDDSQLYSDSIIKTEQFKEFTISKSQFNNHLRNIMLITVKEPTIFEAKVRNSSGNMQTRYEWKDLDLDYLYKKLYLY